MSLRSKPIPTEILEDPRQFRPDEGSAYVFAVSVEDRSAHVESWRPSSPRVHFVSISESSRTAFTHPADTGLARVSLLSRTALTLFWTNLKVNVAFLDITGLPHHIWAPLLRAGLEAGQTIRVVYAEPQEYRFHSSPTPGEIFDLSERIEGISPIPGFASLTEERDEAASVFVPLLGFEGARFAYMLEQVQPPGNKIVPVIGVPGFRPEYPFHTYQGNRLPLSESGSWKKARYACANCPFSLYYTLEDVTREYPGDRLKVAPIGTKPHALGAVLFAISSPSSVELTYDHPIRKARRTEGAARLLVYHVSSFSGT